MKTKSDGVQKAFEPYKQMEIDLVLSLTPTHENVKNLSTVLGRSKEAISTIYNLAYKANWLKSEMARTDGKNNIYLKIVKAKKKHGIFIGYNPKSTDSLIAE